MVFCVPSPFNRFANGKGQRATSMSKQAASAPGFSLVLPEPRRAFAPIAGYLAFYCHPMDQCALLMACSTTTAGQFYGGWVTPWITGPIKGAPGTNHW